MSSLKGKNLILAITGSIAAYKSAILVRLLTKAEANVKVIMTNAAAAFISPLSLSTLSKNPVTSEMFDDDGWHNHVALGLWADAMIIAPCTANTLGKLANGLADNMLVATYLSAKCPVYIAPAMDLDMWKHGSTKDNLTKLESYGDRLIPVGTGELASGLVGEGRMAEPEDIVEFVGQELTPIQDLVGKSIVVTAGPTYEAIDPVRYIGNRSSGKMGIAIADECAKRGGQVTLVLGPSQHEPNHKGVTTVRIKSALDMYNAVNQIYSEMDVAIFAAAVADYTPVTTATEKIKKKGGNLDLELTRTKDIAGEMGKIKSKNQIHIGFALETNNEEANAKRKVEKKNFDFIVLNSLNDKGAGFQHDTNKVTIFHKNGDSKKYPLQSKKKVATVIVNDLVAILHANA